MPEFISFRECVLILENLGYHRHPDDSPYIFISDGSVPGPKGVALEPLTDEDDVSIDAFREWLTQTYIDDDAIKRVLGDFFAGG